MYVSTVDSGNLAAHLLTLRAGLLALPDQPIVSPRVFEGLADTLGVLRESQGSAMTTAHTELRKELAAALAAGVTSLEDARRRLDRIVALASDLAARDPARRHRRRPPQASDAVRPLDWTRALLEQCAGRT